jgi:hypothetical protein
LSEAEIGKQEAGSRDQEAEIRDQRSSEIRDHQRSEIIRDQRSEIRNSQLSLASDHWSLVVSGLWFGLWLRSLISDSLISDSLISDSLISAS